MFGSDGSPVIQYLVIFAIIFSALAAIVFVVRRLTRTGGALQGRGGRVRQPRLGFVDVYESFDKTLNSFVSLFEKVLTDLHRNNPLPQRIRGSSYYTQWDEPESPEFSDDEEALSSYMRDLNLWALIRPINLPDIPKNGYPGNLHHRNFRVRLNGKMLQVYYKLTEYRLVRYPYYHY